MADKKISQLPVGGINPNSIFPIVTDGITSKVSFDDMADAFGGSGSSQTFDQVLGKGNVTTKEFYNQYIHESGIKMLAGVFTGSTNPFPINGVKIDFSDVNPNQFITMGFGIGEGPFIQVDYNQGDETETKTKYFYFEFDFNDTQNGHRILTDKDIQPIYKGIFNQEGTNDPVITEFSNNTQFPSFPFTRANEGVYSCQITGNHIAYINVGQNILSGVNINNTMITANTGYDPKGDQTYFYIYTYSDGILSDNVVANMFFEIGVKEIPNP